MKKTVIITGGSRGIGKGIAKVFAEAGYQLALVSLNKTNLLTAKKELAEFSPKVEIFPCDVTEITQVKDTVKEIFNTFSPVQVLINNAGISGLTPLETENYPLWEKILKTNLNGTFYFSREFFCRNKKENFGRIINISSVYGLTGGAGFSAYCAAKHGLIGLTKSLALEAAPQQITVNALCPGWVETDMFSQDMEELAEYYRIDQEELISGEKMAIPTQRFTTIREIGETALFLASEQAGNITGQAINISGGVYL